MSWNLRVSAALHQGDRKHMEDQYAIHYECCKTTGKFLYAYFGIFDGHGGAEAAKFAKQHLHLNLSSHPDFWSTDPSSVKNAIKGAYKTTHEAMWKELGQWMKTSTGLPSTAGTTASIVLIKDHRIYTGHVGDSGVALGTQASLGLGKWFGKQLTEDHKPDTPREKRRIESMGGAVVPKAQVPRVVWKRPRNLGPVYGREDEYDYIPFLAVARGLGDLWSYCYQTQQYAISPEPDVQHLDLDTNQQTCLVLASDGLWNMMGASIAVSVVENTERKWFREVLYSTKSDPLAGNPYFHHASTLVHTALRRWRDRCLRADNTSALVVLIDPPGESVPKVMTQLSKTIQSVYNNPEAHHTIEGVAMPGSTQEKFCASFYYQKHRLQLSDTERYILLTTKPAEYIEPFCSAQLHYGKPSIRCNVLRGNPSSDSTASLTMYDVIIHKVMTPCKSTSNLHEGRPSASLNALRRSQSTRELKRFRPFSSSGLLSLQNESSAEPSNGAQTKPAACSNSALPEGSTVAADSPGVSPLLWDFSDDNQSNNQDAPKATSTNNSQSSVKSQSANQSAPAPQSTGQSAETSKPESTSSSSLPQPPKCPSRQSRSSSKSIKPSLLRHHRKLALVASPSKKRKANTTLARLVGKRSRSVNSEPIMIKHVEKTEDNSNPMILRPRLATYS